MKKLISIALISIILFTGCNSTKKIDVNKVNYDSYVLKYSVVGSYNKITYNRKNTVLVNKDKYKVEIGNYIYTNNQTCYHEEFADMLNKCKEEKNDIDTSIYTDIFNKATIISDKEENIDNVKYTVYTAEFDKKYLSKISNLDVNKNYKGKIYIDNNGNIYNIIVPIEQLTLSLYYSNYNEDININ